MKIAIAAECNKRFSGWNPVIRIGEIGAYDEKERFCKVEAYVAVTVPGTLLSIPVEYIKLKEDENAIWTAEFIESADNDGKAAAKGTQGEAGSSGAPTREIASTEKMSAPAIPARFLGTWKETGSDGVVVNEMKISNRAIEWTRKGEDKDHVTRYDVEDGGEKVAFDSKVTYSRDVFGGTAYKGDLKVRMKVEGDTLVIEMGGMKVQEEPGITVTTPPDEHRYNRKTSQE